MRRALNLTLFVTVVLIGLLIATLTTVWWVVWLVAFPIMYAGCVGVKAVYDEERNNGRLTKG